MLGLPVSKHFEFARLHLQPKGVFFKQFAFVKLAVFLEKLFSTVGKQISATKALSAVPHGLNIKIRIHVHIDVFHGLGNFEIDYITCFA